MTPEHIKVLKDFHYDENTGFLTRLYNNPKGKRAGGINNFGYRRVYYNNKSVQEHNLIWFYMTGEWPQTGKNEIDHINRKRDDNSWKNLRTVTRQENNYNCGISKNNNSGYNGVSWHKGTKKWRACIMKDYKQKHIGLFNTVEEAHKARKEYDTYANESTGATSSKAI